MNLFNKQTITHGLNCENHYWRVLTDWEDIKLMYYYLVGSTFDNKLLDLFCVLFFTFCK